MEDRNKEERIAIENRNKEQTKCIANRRQKKGNGQMQRQIRWTGMKIKMQR